MVIMSRKKNNLKSLLSEKWLPIEGYEERYEISNYGKVRSNKGSLKILKPWVRVVRGFPCCTINLVMNKKRKKFCLNRLVYHHFINPIDSDYRLSYKDNTLPLDRLNHTLNIKIVSIK